MKETDYSSSTEELAGREYIMVVKKSKAEQDLEHEHAERKNAMTGPMAV